MSLNYAEPFVFWEQKGFYHVMAYNHQSFNLDVNALFLVISEGLFDLRTQNNQTLEGHKLLHEYCFG